MEINLYLLLSLLIALLVISYLLGKLLRVRGVKDFEHHCRVFPFGNEFLASQRVFSGCEFLFLFILRTRLGLCPLAGQPFRYDPIHFVLGEGLSCRRFPCSRRVGVDGCRVRV